MITQSEDRLCHIERWALIRTLQRQSVAEHSYRVALIVNRVAQAMEFSTVKTHVAVMYALYHDELEAVTGDLPKTAKQYVKEAQALVDNSSKLYPVSQMFSVLSEEDRNDVKSVVKLADSWEAILFLRNECSLGNVSVERHLNWLEGKFAESCDDDTYELFMVTTDKMWPDGMGVSNPKMDDDR